MPSNFLPKYCDLLVKNINLVEKIEKAKIEEVIFLLWNLFEGNFLPEFIFNEKILLNFLKKEEKIGEKLALIGLIDYIKPELVEKLNYYYNNIKRKLADSEKEVKRWFIIRRKRRNKGLRVNFRRELFSTFLFLFGVRGLRKIEERYCFYIIRTLTPSFIKKLINQLKTEYERLKKMGKMNDKREKLYLDAIDWLNSYCLM
jgi:hypothetical protein